MKMVTIRELEKDDIEKSIKLFRDTVHNVNAKDYTQEQLDAWAPEVVDYARWNTLLDNISYIAEDNHDVVGFGDVTKYGYLDRLFVHKDYQGKGVATQLLKKLEDKAKQLGVKEIATETSITAQPFFEKHGYAIYLRQTKELRGVKLVNVVMKKKIV
jgi:putative acetyltransferase